MDLFLALIFGILVVALIIAFYALMAILVPILVGLGLFASAVIIIYALLKSRHEK